MPPRLPACISGCTGRDWDEEGTFLDRASPLEPPVSPACLPVSMQAADDAAGTAASPCRAGEVAAESE